MLPLRRERFCQEYIIDFNAKQAAIRAGYSAHTAEKQGSRLLTFVEVTLRVDDLLDGLTERVKLTAEKVLYDIATIKKSCLTTNPQVALKACELEAKYLGILTDRLEHSGTVKTETSYWVDFVDLRKDENKSSKNIAVSVPSEKD